MNWVAVSAIADVVASVGVIISLIYLAVQVRQNTAMMSGAAKVQQADLGQNLLLYFAEHPDISEKIKSGEKTTSSEETQISFSSRALFRAWETYAYLHDAGLLDEPEWIGLKNAMQRAIKQPGHERIYREMREEISPRLREVMEPIVGEVQPDKSLETDA